MKEGKNCENGSCYGLIFFFKVFGCVIRERDLFYRMDREACCLGFCGNQGDVKIQVILDLFYGKRFWNFRQDRQVVEMRVYCFFKINEVNLGNGREEG